MKTTIKGLPQFLLAAWLMLGATACDGASMEPTPVADLPPTATTPAPTATPTHTPSPTFTATPTQTATPTVTPEPTVAPTQPPTPEPTPRPSQEDIYRAMIATIVWPEKSTRNDAITNYQLNDARQEFSFNTGGFTVVEHSTQRVVVAKQFVNGKKFVFISSNNCRLRFNGASADSDLAQFNGYTPEASKISDRVDQSVNYFLSTYGFTCTQAEKNALQKLVGVSKSALDALFTRGDVSVLRAEIEKSGAVFDAYIHDVDGITVLRTDLFGLISSLR